MADLVATRYTTLAADDVLVRAVQFFTNENWRAQSQTNRIATFVGVPKLPWFQFLLAILLTFCLVIPGLIYYLLVVRKALRLQNLVVTTTPKEVGCDVVVTYPSYAYRYVASFFAALPGGPPPEAPLVSCTDCGTAIGPGAKFCASCGSSSLSAAPPPLPPLTS